MENAINDNYHTARRKDDDIRENDDPENVEVLQSFQIGHR
jgi:hypothetical protein